MMFPKLKKLNPLKLESLSGKSRPRFTGVWVKNGNFKGNLKKRWYIYHLFACNFCIFGLSKIMKKGLNCWIFLKNLTFFDWTILKGCYLTKWNFPRKINLALSVKRVSKHLKRFKKWLKNDYKSLNNTWARDLKKNSWKYGLGLNRRWALFTAWAFGFKLHLIFHRVEYKTRFNMLLGGFS